MVQVDVFWSYAIGAGFAFSAARQLRARHELRSTGRRDARLEALIGEPGPGDRGVGEIRGDDPQPNTWWRDALDLLQQRHMMLNILFVALLFAPSGIYLVWGYPEWETMQAGDRSMPAWLIVSFAITNVSQAILGFWVTERLIVHGRQYLAFLQAWIGYLGLFFLLVNGWDRTGWQRFFSEDRAGFEAWSTQPAMDHVTSWLTSDVALTLYAMGVVLIPVMAVIMLRAWSQGRQIGGAYAPRKPAFAWPLLLGAYLAFAFSGVPIAIGAHVLIEALGWIPGVAVAAVLTYAVFLRSGTGVFYLGYRYADTEDDAYDALRAGRLGAPPPPAPRAAAPTPA
jgi:hypothetical protein